MTERNDGRAYEAMVKAVYESLCSDERLTTVEHNVKLTGPDGERQIDVLVVHSHAGIKYLTIIECRDFSGKISVTHIDAFASKVCDVKANKGILVARKGFSKTAIQKANRLGIGLCTVDTAERLLKDMVIEVPVVVVMVEPELNTRILVKPERRTFIPHTQTATINDVKLSDLVIEELQTGAIKIPSESTSTPWSPKRLSPPFHIRDDNNEPITIEWFIVDLTLHVSYYFGKTNDLPDLISHVTIGDDTARIFVPDEFKIRLNGSFKKYRRRSDVPLSTTGAIVGIATPKVGDKSESRHQTFLLKR